MIWSLDYPTLLDRHEQAWSRENELDDLYRLRTAAQKRKEAAERSMLSADSESDADAAAMLWDQASDEIGELDKRIWGLEDANARAYERQVISDFLSGR
jgi:hypothetical protein